jgi:FtsZ-binding cell division protein ZapB
VYQKVQSFLEVNTNLQTVMQELQAQNNCLVTSDSELKKMAEDIRRQATDALK